MATSVISYKSVETITEYVSAYSLSSSGLGPQGSTTFTFSYVPNIVGFDNFESVSVIGDLLKTNEGIYAVGTYYVSGNLNQFFVTFPDSSRNVRFTKTSSSYDASTSSLSIDYNVDYYNTASPIYIITMLSIEIMGTITIFPAYIARYTYSLLYNGEVRIYKAVAVNSSTFDDVDLVYKVDASFDGGTTWLAQKGGNYFTKHSPLDYTKISPIVVNDLTPTTFAYSFTDINGAVKSVDTMSITPVDLASGNSKFSLLPTTSYLKGETIVLADILSDLVANGKLLFSDYEQVAISSVEKASGYNHKVEFVYEGTYFNGLSSVFVDDNTPTNFAIKLTLYTKYYGTLEYTYAVSVSGTASDYVISVALTTPKTAFKVGDRVVFGDDAVLTTYNIDNEVIDTYTGDSEILAFLNDNNYKGSFIGVNQLTMGASGTIIDVASHSTYNFISDGAKIITHKFSNKQFTQVIYVSYAESELRLTPPTNSGTKQLPLIVDSDGLTISTTGFKAQVRYHTNTSSGMTPTLIDITSSVSLTWSQSSITYPEAIANSGQAIDIQITDAYEGLSVSNYIQVWVDYLRPIAISISGSDTIPYYIGKTTKFQIPTFNNETEYATYRFEFNDGTFTDLTANQILNLVYRASASTSSTPLVDDTSDITSSQSSLYASCEYVIENGDNDITLNLFGSYALNRVADAISSLEILNELTFVLGNPYQKEFFVVKATYASGDVNNDFLNYTFNTSDGVLKDGIRYIMESSDIPSGGIVVYADNQTFTLSKSKITTYTSPAVEDVEVITNGLPLAYNNGTDKINISNVELLVSFENASYTQLITFNANNTASTTEYSVQAQKKADHTNILESVNYYNGTDFVDVIGLTDALSCEFVFSFNNRFIPENTCTIGRLDFTIAAIQEIKSIIINKNPYTDYVVGDTFLNENDTTEVVISYQDGNSNYRSMTINLNSGFPSLAVMPQQGTIWKNLDNSKTIKVSSVLDQSIYAEYSISVAPKGYVSTTRVHDLVVVWQESLTLNDSTIFTTDYGVLVLVKEEDTEVSDGVRSLLSGLSIGYQVGNARPYGYIDDFFNEDSACKVVMFNDYLPPIEGSPNQTINFPCYRDGNADLINKCRIGILFGSNNATNRLFVSGNPDVPNADWHTSEINTTNVDGEILKTNGDFSYFANESIMYYGETDNAVIGYDIVSNDKLLVLKSKSDKEKTVYFRTPTLLKAMDSSGNVMTDINGETLYQEEYSLVKGNNSNAGISPHTIVNFNGDTLFVDADKQIVGLDVEGIVGDNQRYANTRSKYIDNRLAKLDLSNAKLWTNNKYLFLSIPNFGLFATHFTTASEGQYEWWYLTSHDYTTFIEIDDVIYFGNDNGVFGKLFNGIYQDIERVFVGKAQSILATVDKTNEAVTIDMNLMMELDENKTYTFKVIADNDSYYNHIFYQIAKMNNVKKADTDLYIDEANNRIEIVGMVNGVENSDRKLYIINKIRENDVYYLNYLFGSTVKIDADATSPFTNFGDKYKFVYVENPTGNDYFTIQKGIVDNGVLTWNDVSVNGLNNAGLCKRLDHDCDISDIDHDNNLFKLKLDGEYLDLVQYGYQVIYRNFKAQISEWKNVEAYYIVAPMVMGNLNNFKTIWGFTLTNDTDLPSELYITYASNKIPISSTKTLAGISQAALTLNFEDMDFTKVDFDKLVVPRTYTIHRVLAYQKFICFGFKNSNNTNAVLSAMSVTYTIPHPSYGSD